MGRLRGVLLLVLLCSALVVPSGASFARVGEVTNTAAPTVAGTPRFATKATASPGSWTPEPASTSYQWLVDGAPVPDATGSSYTPRLRDIGHDLSVRVTATATGFAPGTATSRP